MTRGKPKPPTRDRAAQRAPQGILELDRFNETTLSKWAEVSRDLDELHDALHFSVEPERRRLRPELIAALQRVPPIAVELLKWARIVTYEFSSEPLSCAGSLRYIGGRFNPGFEMDSGTLGPWPALYLAEDFETAYREKFQIARQEAVDGLSPEELSLEHGVSHSTVFVRGQLHRVFDLTMDSGLGPIAAVFRKIKMPVRARQLKKKLNISANGLSMVQTGKQLYEAVLKHNWRVLPVQFGLPAQSQVMADLIRAAGFEAILYPSTKGGGKCLAVFPDCIDSGSFVELVDAAPASVKHRRLDAQSSDALEGWGSIPSKYRPQ